MLLFAFLACAPVYRFPGPLAGLGREPAPGWDVRPEAPERPDRPRRSLPAGEAVARAAAGFVGDAALYVDGERFRYDCSGLVEAALAAGNCRFVGSTANLFEQARALRVLHRRRVPSPGDVAFFDDTYDRNGNGRRDDALSHSAVVESVDARGTITLVHVGSQGVVRFHMNLRRPEERVDEAGNLLNDPLRAPRLGDSPRTRRLAGELWVGFASFWQADQEMALRSTR